MKALLLIILFLSGTHLLFSQQPVIVNEKQFGGSGEEIPFAYGAAENGLQVGEPLVFVGSSTSGDGDLPGNEGQSDAWFAREQSSLEYLSNNFGGSQADGFNHALTLEDLAILLGYTKSPEVPSHHGGEDIYLAAVDTNANLDYERAFGGSGNETGIYLSPKLSGFQLAVSYGTIEADGDWTGATPFDFFDIGVLKFDANYNVVDKKLFGALTFGYDFAYDAYADDNKVRILGGTNSTGGSFETAVKGGDDIIVIDISVDDLLKNGEYRYGGTKVERGNDIKPHPDGGFFIAGASWSNEWNFGDDNAEVRQINCTTDGEINPNGIVFRADASGNIIWSQCLEGSDWDFAQSLYYQHPDILYVIGYTASNDVDFPPGNPFSYDCFIAALDANTGEKKWIKVYGGSLDDFGKDIVRLPNGNLLTLNETSSTDGDVMSPGHGLSEVWMVEFTNPTGIEEVSPVTELIAYPNPADQAVTIDLPSNKTVDQIEILNTRGQVILASNPQQPPLRLNVSNLPDGFYFFRINQNHHTYYSKVVVAH